MIETMTRSEFSSSHLLKIIALVLTLGISGCVNTDRSDLENYVADVLSRPGDEIPPLPAIKPYERYLYQAEQLSLRDPFVPFFQEAPEAEDVEKIVDSRQQEFANEILTHNREELEQFELDSLRMVGVLENPASMWGIVSDAAGTVHRVQVGNYLGRNYGKITNIQEDRIDIREIIRDSQGNWEEREAGLALSEQ